MRIVITPGRTKKHKRFGVRRTYALVCFLSTLEIPVRRCAAPNGKHNQRFGSLFGGPIKNGQCSVAKTMIWDHFFSIRSTPQTTFRWAHQNDTFAGMNSTIWDHVCSTRSTHPKRLVGGSIEMTNLQLWNR